MSKHIGTIAGRVENWSDRDLHNVAQCTYDKEEIDVTRFLGVKDQGVMAQLSLDFANKKGYIQLDQEGLVKLRDALNECITE